MDASRLPNDWRAAIGPDSTALLDGIVERVNAARLTRPNIYPPADQLFTAFALTRFDAVRAVILGQDPYPTLGHAHGLAFSVPATVSPLPRTLQNILAERTTDLGVALPRHGCLDGWAKNGVLLLNSALTFERGAGTLDGQRMWARFTDAVVEVLAARRNPLVFLLWGEFAKRRAAVIRGRQPVVCSAHPSPQSARSGFFCSKPFSRANAELRARQVEEIVW